jgi:hypothetical protein
LQNFLARVDRDVERLVASAVAERGRDSVREAALLREADRLQFQTRNEREELLRIGREATQVRSQGAALEAKLREAQAWLQDQMRRINGEGTKLGRTEKGLKATERKVNEPVTGSTSRVRVTASRLNAIASYEEFSLDAEKQRVLESLKSSTSRVE